MKFPSCAALLVTSAAGLSCADAFVPSSLAFAMRLVTSFSKEASVGVDAAGEVKSKEAAYQAYFAIPNPLELLPKPKHDIEHWEAGVNPVMIEVAKKLDQLPDNMVEHIGELELQDLDDDKRLFFGSYDDITELEVTYQWI